LVGSRPSGSVCDWQRPRGITGSPWNAYWPRPEWVENQVCCGAYRVTHQRCSCYSTGSAWSDTQLVCACDPQSLFCRILIDSRTVVRPAGVLPPHFALRLDNVKHGHSDDTDHTRSFPVVAVTHGDGQTRGSFTARVGGHSHPPLTTHHPPPTTHSRPTHPRLHQVPITAPRTSAQGPAHLYISYPRRLRAGLCGDDSGGAKFHHPPPTLPKHWFEGGSNVGVW